MSKPIGTAGLNLIKSFEGCKLTAYKCPAGVWTIGYGHTAGVYKGMTITQAQADSFLIEDCQSAADYVDNPSYCPLTHVLNSNQRDALISFTFNCGCGNLRTLCKGRSLSEIAKALLLYNKSKGKTLAGLTRRRKAEQALFHKAVKVNATQTQAQEVNYNMPTIKKGCKGKAVKIWQIILGFSGDAVDGVFGSDTETATRNFQKRKALAVDGIVGKNSWKAGLDSIE